MTCNDCVYFGLCEALSVYYDMPIGGASECALYKNKADFVEVVRCKDCKYQEDCARQMVHTTRDHVLEQNISSYNKVDFCSYGERKDGADK